jgi:hypothetical protein
MSLFQRIKQKIEAKSLNTLTIVILIGFNLILITGLFISNIHNKQKEVELVTLKTNMYSSTSESKSYIHISNTPSPLPTNTLIEMYPHMNCDADGDKLITNVEGMLYCQITSVPCEIQGVSPAFYLTIPVNMLHFRSGGPGETNYHFRDSYNDDIYISHKGFEMSIDQLNSLLTEEYLIDPPYNIRNLGIHKLKDKKFIQIGDKRILQVNYIQNYNDNNRELKSYFFTDPQNESLFHVEIDVNNTTPNYLMLIKQVEEIIKTMNFLPNQVNENC